MNRSHLRVCHLVVAILSFSANAASQAPAGPQAPAGSPPGAGSAALDRTGAFERARIHYESGNYSACIDTLSKLLASESGSTNVDPRQNSAMRTYLAACLIGARRIEQAREQFRQAILEDRQMEVPDPVVFPQAVIDLFIQVHGSLMEALRRQQEEDLRRGREEALERAQREEQERRRVAELERLASTEVLVHRNQRWMAYVPFGVGQFNNGEDGLGWLFLTSEAVLAITAITATSIELGLHTRAEGGQANLDSRDLNNQLQAARSVGRISLGALLVVAAAGVVEANLSYRSEILLGRRPRELPDTLRQPAPRPTPRVTPQVEPRTSGAWLGLGGTF
jgi:hypothetical protein